MSHARTTIRDAAVTACRGLAGYSSANCIGGRVHEVDVVPFIAIYTASESSEPLSVNSRNLSRVLQLVVECYESGADVDAELDTLAASVEGVITDEIGGTDYAFLESTEKELQEGDARYGVARLIFNVTYHASQDDAATII